ncbi:hypothetical protein PG995_015028 [Apiospora arundinis]
MAASTASSESIRLQEIACINRPLTTVCETGTTQHHSPENDPQNETVSPETSSTTDEDKFTLVEPGVENGLPSLNFRPMSLKLAFLYWVLFWNLSITALLIAVVIIPEFSLKGVWSYFVIQIMPTVIGTVTSVLLESVVMNLFRITPYIICASRVKQQRDSGTPHSLNSSSDGSKAGKTIMRTFFPSPGFRTAVRSRDDISHGNVLLSVSFLLKRSRAYTTDWAALILLVFYCLVDIHTIWVILYLNDRDTGLLWDPVSIADQLALFRGARFVPKIEGSSVATADSMRHQFKDETLMLGYWKCGNTYWHGFGPKMDLTGINHNEDTDLRTTEPSYGYEPQRGPTERRESSNEEFQEHTRANHNGSSGSQSNAQRITESTPNPAGRESAQVKLLTEEELRDMRYATSNLFMTHGVLYFYAILAIILGAGFIIALAMSGARRGKRDLHVDMSYYVSQFLCQWLPITATCFFAWLWEDLSMFHAKTQPFKAMSCGTGVSADDSLLLNYTCLPRPVAIFVALAKGHAKIAFLMAMAILARLLPIVTAASFTIIGGEDDKETLIRFSLPLSIIVIVWLAIYLVLIVWILATEERERQLPRYYYTIADLLSWTCSSSLLRDDKFAGVSKGNPFDVVLKGREQVQDEKEEAVVNRASGQGQQWHMKARLRMAQKRYRFGVVPVQGENNLYTIGIEAGDSHDARIPLSEPKPAWFVRICRSRKGKGNGQNGQQSTRSERNRLVVSDDLEMIKPKSA